MLLSVWTGKMDELNSRIAELMSDAASKGQELTQLTTALEEKVWLAWLWSFSALKLLVGRQRGHLTHKKFDWWVAGVVICLERGVNDLHMVQLMPLPLRHLLLREKSRMVLPFWYRLTQVNLQKRPFNGCSSSWSNIFTFETPFFRCMWIN